MSYAHPNGSTETVVLGLKNVDGVVSFYMDAVKLQGEYMNIGTDGSLEFFDEKGLVKVMPKQ